MLAITVPFIEKFACIVAGKIIGISRHPDYWEYHYRKRDLAKVRIEGLTKFVRVNSQGRVESIVLAENLLTKGTKVEPQPVETLTDEEKTEISAAVESMNRTEPSETATGTATDERDTTTIAEPKEAAQSATKSSKKKSPICAPHL